MVHKQVVFFFFFPNEIKMQKNMINSSHFNDIKINLIKNQQLAVSPNTWKHTDLVK